MGGKMLQRWEYFFRSFARQLQIKRVRAEINTSRPLGVPGLSQSDLIEHSRLRPCGKNTSSDVGGQIHIADSPVVVADKELEVSLRSGFNKIH